MHFVNEHVLDFGHISSLMNLDQFNHCISLVLIIKHVLSIYD